MNKETHMKESHMANVNLVFLLGHLGHDLEHRSTANGTPVVNFRMATTQRWKDESGEKQERTEWHRVVSFGPTAEFLKEYATKGSMLHVEGSSRSGELPSVREMLERWGLLEEGSSRSAVYENFNVRVKKKVVKGRPLPVILDYLEKGYVDLVVVATKGSGGVAGWLKPSVSEPLAHRTDTSTLFVPIGKPGMVDPATGQLTARKILVPVAEVPDAQNAVTLAARTAIAAHQVHGDPVELQALRELQPGIAFPSDSAWQKESPSM